MSVMDEFEYPEALDDAEDIYGGEGIDDEEEAEDSRESRRRTRARAVARARYRQAVRQRRRQAAVARRAPVRTAPTPGPRAVVSAVKELDLQTQVQQADLRAAMDAANRRVDRANLAAVAAVLVPVLLDNVLKLNNAFAKAAIQAAPLALLPGGKKREGAAGLLTMPVVYGGAGALGLAAIGELRKRGDKVASVKVTGPATLTVGQKALFIVDITDAGGRASTATVTFDSSDTAVATVDATGVVTVVAPGFAVITATADGVKARSGLNVVADTDVG